MKKKNAIISALLGIFIIYWAQTHSPKAGFGEIIKNEFAGSYTMSENWYYVTLILGIALAVWGVLKFLKK